MNFKFRVWHKPSKEFITFLKEHSPHGDLLINLSGNLLFDHCEDYMGICPIHKKENYVIQLFTGMKDSCGVEIYEGDIIECGSAREPVTFDNGVFWADLPNEVYLYEVNRWCKVVGHINGI